MVYASSTSISAPPLRCIPPSRATHLDLHGPLDVPTLGDSLVQVPLGVIGILTAGDGSLVHVKGLDRVMSDPVVLRNQGRRVSARRTDRSHEWVGAYLDKSALALGVDPSELRERDRQISAHVPLDATIRATAQTHSVCSVSVKVVRDRSSVVREQHQPGVLGLGHVGEEVEPPVVVEQERLGFSLLRSNVVGSLEGVSLRIRGGMAISMWSGSTPSKAGNRLTTKKTGKFNPTKS